MFFWVKNVLHFAIHDVIKELTIFGELHDDIYVGRSLYDFVHLGDGRVPGDFEDMKLSGNPFDVSDIFDFFFFEDFDGDWFVGGSVDCEFNFSESALPNSFAAYVRGVPDNIRLELIFRYLHCYLNFIMRRPKTKINLNQRVMLRKLSNSLISCFINLIFSYLSRIYCFFLLYIFWF